MSIHTTAMSVIKYTDNGSDLRVVVCSDHLLSVLREHLGQGPSILPAPRRVSCGESIRAEYEFVVSHRPEKSGEGYEVYQARVLDFTGNVGEYDTVEDFEVTTAPAADPELPGVHPLTIAFVDAVDIATRELEARGYTRTQSVTCRGSFGDGRVSK